MNSERRPSPPQRMARLCRLSATQLWLSNKQLTPPSVTRNTVQEAGLPVTRVWSPGPANSSSAGIRTLYPGRPGSHAVGAL